MRELMGASGARFFKIFLGGGGGVWGHVAREILGNE